MDLDVVVDHELDQPGGGRVVALSPADRNDVCAREVPQEGLGVVAPSKVEGKRVVDRSGGLAVDATSEHLKLVGEQIVLVPGGVGQVGLDGGDGVPGVQIGAQVPFLLVGNAARVDRNL